MTNGKIIIITAPSGSGKTTLVKRLLAATNNLAFSISACTRQPRAGEEHGIDYYFYPESEFKRLIEEDAFLEWEMVYAGKYYGTLKTELSRIWSENKCPLVDIDVKGALAVRDKYPNQCLSIFIKAPSIDVLRQRLVSRGTETTETLKERVEKAEEELKYADKFDCVIVNDDLDIAAKTLIDTIEKYLN